MADFQVTDKGAIVIPALTDLHLVSQGGVLKKETTSQILSLATSANIDAIALAWKLDGNTWTFSSADTNGTPTYVFNINARATEYIFVRQKIKYTQNLTTKYGIVVAVGAYTGSLTPITIYGGGTLAASPPSWGAMTSGAITNPYFSTTDRPLDFPMTDTNITNPWEMRYEISGNHYMYNAAAGTYYGGANALTGGNISGFLGIGLWELKLDALFSNNSYVDSVERYFAFGLSFNNNAFNNVDLITFYITNSVTGLAYISGARENNRILKVNQTAVQQFWVLCLSSISSSTTLAFRGDYQPIIIEAKCAYL